VVSAETGARQTRSRAVAALGAPSNAQPLQYVKICSLYGAGFYYIPGTDTCLKVGGWVRAEYNIGSGGSFSPIRSDNYDRYFDDTVNRSRGIITLDARAQTEYGTLRSYIAGGFQATNGTNGQIYHNRAFIQWAGFTAGRAVSFFDFYVTPRYSNTTNVWASDTGGGGDFVMAYTAQLGNGLSASLSLEDASTRRTRIYDAAGGGNNYGGAGWPDVAANLRVDQAWGSAQVMGAIHQVKAGYYTPAVMGSGHPSDEVGYALGAGVMLHLPWTKGDSFTTQFTYSKGAMAYVGSTLGAGFSLQHGNSIGLGIVSDATYDSATTSSLELTTGWSVVAGADHHWNSHWRTSLYGSYGQISYSSTGAGYLNGNVGAAAGSDPDFSFWQIGSRTVWVPVHNLNLSVDIMYNNLNTGYDGLVDAAGRTIGDQHAWQGIFRVQRNFYP
jgi:hypothetical protein